jgi:hypothetical protein
LAKEFPQKMGFLLSANNVGLSTTTHGMQLIKTREWRRVGVTDKIIPTSQESIASNVGITSLRLNGMLSFNLKIVDAKFAVRTLHRA